jgi:hypothetical protein
MQSRRGRRQPIDRSQGKNNSKGSMAFSVRGTKAASSSNGHTSRSATGWSAAKGSTPSAAAPTETSRSCTIRNQHRASCCQPFSAWQSQDLWPLAAGFPGELHRRWRERPEETRSNGTGRRGRNRAPRNQNPREAEASLSRFPLSRRLQGFGPDLSGRWTAGGRIAERWN